MRGQGAMNVPTDAMKQSLPGEVDNLISRLRDVAELDNTIGELQNHLAETRDHREDVLAECRKLRALIQERFNDETNRLDPVAEPTQVDFPDILPCRSMAKGKYCTLPRGHDAHEGTDHQDSLGNIWPAHVLMNDPRESGVDLTRGVDANKPGGSADYMVGP